MRIFLELLFPEDGTAPDEMGDRRSESHCFYHVTSPFIDPLLEIQIRQYLSILPKSGKSPALTY